MQKLCVIGLGYIGLPTAIIAAESGYNVVGVDVNQAIVDQLNESRMHFSEPFLDDLLASEVAKGRLIGKLVPEAADYFVIAVPTPFKEGFHPDISYVESAATSIAQYLKPGDTIILESTVPVGTTEHLCDLLGQIRSDLNFPSNVAGKAPDVFVAFCPERVLPGKIAEELRKNDRIIGGITPSCTQKAAEFYRAFVEGSCHQTSARVAELVKLSENAFRDVNIAFANELSLICNDQKIDQWEVVELANKHPRVNILSPGPGVGGHCIAVDPWFIVHTNPDRANLIKTAREVNLAKTDWVIEQVNQAIEQGKFKSIAFLGLAYKPDASDLRESPAIHIIKDVMRSNPNIAHLLVEPHISNLPEALQNGKLVSIGEALEAADLVVCLVAHSQFAENSDRIGATNVIDTVGIVGKG
jgi:UDP-N-acetyl-D-mannosaminuronic acid dehydrogenase|tara:strand:- start:17328 stop:18566 length:1239 start_codon:yes stop_codon:yes gene_type:complete